MKVAASIIGFQATKPYPFNVKNTAQGKIVKMSTHIFYNDIEAAWAVLVLGGLHLLPKKLCNG